MILSGIAIAALLAQREARRFGENPEHVMNIAVIGTICALIGARFYHVVDRDQWPYYSQNPGQIIAIWNGGIGIFGAVAGAIAGLLIYVAWNNRKAGNVGSYAKRMGYLRWLDIGAPAFLLGQAIGRWGNFFNQELFGPPSSLPWAIPIDTEFRPAIHIAETHFHPLFLYESAMSLAGVFALLYIGRRFANRLKTGDILLLYFIWYPAERFILEFLRMDNWKMGALPMAQIIGVFCILGAATALGTWKRPPMMATTVLGSRESSRSRSAGRRLRRRSR